MDGGGGDFRSVFGGAGGGNRPVQSSSPQPPQASRQHQRASGGGGGRFSRGGRGGGGRGGRGDGGVGFTPYRENNNSSGINDQHNHHHHHHRATTTNTAQRGGARGGTTTTSGSHHQSSSSSTLPHHHHPRTEVGKLLQKFLQALQMVVGSNASGGGGALDQSLTTSMKRDELCAMILERVVMINSSSMTTTTMNSGSSGTTEELLESQRDHHHGGGVSFSLESMLQDCSEVSRVALVVHSNNNSNNTTVQQQQQRQDAYSLWSVIFVLLTNVTSLERIVLQERRKGWYSAIKTACERMNLLGDMFAELYRTTTGGCHFPMPCIAIVLRVYRSIFELATIATMNEVGSNIASCCQKIFRSLPPDLRELKELKEAPSRDEKSALLLPSLCATATLIAELGATKSLDEKQVRFLASFHKFCPEFAALRVVLYHRVGSTYLAKHNIHEALRHFSAGYDLCPDIEVGGGVVGGNAVHHPNKRAIYISMTAANLALGKLPDQRLQELHPIPAFDDLFAALRCASLELFDIALTNNLQFFLRWNVLHAVQQLRTSIILAMVVKFFNSQGCLRSFELIQFAKYYRHDTAISEILRSHTDIIDVDDEKQWDVISDTTAYNGTAGALVTSLAGCFFLPLLNSKRINGALGAGSIILAKNKPFDDFPELSCVA